MQWFKYKMMDWKTVLVIWFFTRRINITTAQHGVLPVENLALNKPTNQSSTANFISDLAVNGNYEDFSETTSDAFNWWIVSLQKKEKVVVINVLHLKICCGQTPIQISIYTSGFNEPGSLSQSNGKWVQEYSQTQYTNWFHYDAATTSYKYVKATSVGVIGRTNRQLSLQEVEIFGRIETANVARGGQASQSEGDRHVGVYPASNAVNGILTDFAKANDAPFWQVDLGAIYSCESIRFFNGQNFTVDNRVKIKFLIRYKQGESFNEEFIIDETERPMIINYSFPSVRGVRFENLVIAQPLIISEVEAFIAINPAFGKPTKQSTIYEAYTSSLAVNGFNGDFSHTLRSNNPWWTVDLLEIHSLSSVDIISERLYGVLLYTSKRHQQNTNFDQWVLTKYTAREFGHKENIAIPTLLMNVRHIAIQINRTNAVLALAEVIVNEFNFADRRLGVYQSSVYANDSNRFGPRNALDFAYNTAAFSNYNADSNQWWRLKLNEIILMTSIKIRFKSGLCGTSGGRVKCVKVAAKINISTTNSESGDDPSEWKLCHSQSYIQSPVHIGCDRNHRQPFTWHVIIQPQSDEFMIALAEVEVFGRVLPRFSWDAVASVHSVTSTSAQLTFDVWNSNNEGNIAPTTYRVTLNESENMTTFRPTRAQSGKITANMNELNPSTSYEYEIACWLRGMPCLGKAIKGQFTTLSCPAPNRPNHTYSRINDGAKSRSFRIIVHDTNDNCPGSPKYRVTLVTGGVILYNQSGQSHSIINIARDIDLVLTSMITNRDEKSSSLQQQVEAERDVPAIPKLTKFEFNSTCVHLRVSSETDFLYAKMLYKFTCSFGGEVRRGSVNSSTTRKASQVFCGIAANANGFCKVVVENNIGESEALIVNNTTKVQPTAIVNEATKSTENGFKETEVPLSGTKTPENIFKKTEVPDRKSEKTTILVAVGAGTALVMITLVAVCWYLRRRKKTAKVVQSPAKRKKISEVDHSPAKRRINSLLKEKQHNMWISHLLREANQQK